MSVYSCRILLTFLFVLVLRVALHADEPRECFQAFAAATANYEQGKAREAAAALQALSQKFQTTPWRDIVLVKSAELHESFDRATATKNYEEVLTRLKDRTTEKLGTLLVSLANRGLQRLESAEIEEALKKYYIDKVEYPISLEVLAQGKYIADAKIRDGAGKVYVYSPGVEKLIPTVPRQSYTLEKLPAPSFVWKGAKIVGMSAQAALVEWPNAASRSLRVGDKADDLEVFSVLDNGVVLGNDSRLVVLSSK